MTTPSTYYNVAQGFEIAAHVVQPIVFLHDQLVRFEIEQINQN